MLEKFKMWFQEIEVQAMSTQKPWRAPEKNRDIKNTFRDKFEKLGADEKQVYFSRPSYKAKTGEWLYDFVARRLDDSGGVKDLLEVFLVMEIELSYPREVDHRYDFNKLLQADSLYKIFVFQHENRAGVEMAAEKLKAAARKYRFRCDSDFLLCGWSKTEKQFIFDDFRVVDGVCVV